MVDRILSLIHISELTEAGEDPRAFRRAARAGHYIRLRRGIYCSRAEWDLASPAIQHVARTQAVFSQLRDGKPALAAGYSAAALHGLKVMRRWPDAVTLLVPYRGGGTAEPGVVRTAARWNEHHAAVARGVPTTSVERTLFDLVLLDGFAGGVASMDAALRAGSTDLPRLGALLDTWAPPTGAARCAAALAFADAASGSFGESVARARIRMLGFPDPQLQHAFTDEQGPMFVDFCWPEFGVAAEFDGKEKYSREEFTDGDPGEVVWREKQREDRLRRQVRAVVRLTWATVHDRAQLASLLRNAGVPQGRRAYGRGDTAARVSFGA